MTMITMPVKWAPKLCRSSKQKSSPLARDSRRVFGMQRAAILSAKLPDKTIWIQLG